MKKFKFKGVAAVAALIVALPCAVSPVLANSGPSREYGVTGSGVIVRNEQSALAVESEKLTFDIVDFPVRYMEETVEYKSTVTAEYKFVNTSANTVHTSMAFPIKQSYRNSFDSPQNFTADISVDGEPVDCVMRYTAGNYTSFDECVGFISDEWYSDDFYSADLPVTKYTVSVNRPAEYNRVRLTANVRCDKSKARYMGNSFSLAYYFDFDENNGGSFYDLATQNKVNYFYVLGDTSAISFEWITEAAENRNGYLSSYKVIDVPHLITVDSVTTLKDLILSERDADSSISEVDYYNAVTRNLNNDDFAGYLSSLKFAMDDMLVWYTYDVEVEPNGSIVNKITAPIIPTTYYTYAPYVYEYEYYLSPAAKWASFGRLEVFINSQYFMVNPPKGFERCEGGYRAEFSSLPDGELTFRMSTVEKPGRGSRARTSMGFGIFFLVLLCIICIVVPLAVFIPYIVKAVKKRRAEKKLDFSSKGY